MSSKDGVARVLPQAVQHDSDSPPALKLSESSKGEARKRAALLNDVVLRDLQILTQIPDEKAMQFRLDVQCALDIVWDDYDARAALAEPRCASRLRQIAGQAAKLQQSLMSGGAGVHRLLFAAWPNEAAVSLIDCERMCEFLAEIAADAAVGAVGGWRNRPRAAHRPEGSGNWRLKLFVWRLLVAVVRAGGAQLTANKNYEQGSLYDAMELLRPFFPPKMLAKRLPYATLAKLKAEWTNNWRNQQPQGD